MTELSILYQVTLVLLSAAMGGLVFFIAILLGKQIAEKDTKQFQDEAVKRGFASWIPNKKGKSRFEWKER